MIDPKLSSLYQWRMDQNATSVVVEFPFPEPSFNPEIIKVRLDLEKGILLVEIANEIPIIEGTLYKVCKSFSTSVDSSKRASGEVCMILTLAKTDSENWPFLISGWNPNTSSIDPKSSYDLFIFATRTQNPDLIEQSADFFNTSIGVGFVPSLLFAYEKSLRVPDQAEVGMNLLEIAALTYKDATAMVKLGVQYEMVEDSKDDAFQLFKEAASLGAYIAMSFMGQMISPLSDVSFHHKDAEKAIQLFKGVLENDQNEPIALYEYSKLLFHGVGVAADREGALEMFERAKAVEPNFPPIDSLVEIGKPDVFQEEKKKFFTPFRIVVIFSCSTFAVVSAVIIARYMRNRNKAVLASAIK